jgi:hypothetical protein
MEVSAIMFSMTLKSYALGPLLSIPRHFSNAFVVVAALWRLLGDLLTPAPLLHHTGVADGYSHASAARSAETGQTPRAEVALEIAQFVKNVSFLWPHYYFGK